jgi:hypothetical protein
MATHQVHALLMGGQACVFYGGAEFSRDTDLLILATGGDPAALEQALLAEEMAERERDRQYWQPLKAELEALRRAALRSASP